MRYLFPAIFSFCTACGNSSGTTGNNSTTTDTTVATQAAVAPSSADDTIICTEEQALEAIRKLPEIVKQQQYLDSLTNHTKGVAYMTNSKTIDGRDFYEIAAGYNGELRWENYYIFYVDKQDCSNISVIDPVEGNIISIEEWHKEASKTTDASQPVATHTVKLPFNFDEYYSACVYPGDENKCSDTYPSYPIDNDANLKTLVNKAIDGEATDYFVLPAENSISAYIIAFTQTDVERYYLITVANNKIVGKLQIGQADDNGLLYFQIDKSNTVTLYSRKNATEKGKLVQIYNVANDGNISVKK